MAKLPSGYKPPVIRPFKVSAIRNGNPLITQREFRQAHAAYLAANWDFNAMGLLIVNVHHGIPYLIDGQHRHAALKQCGYEDMEVMCECYEDKNDADSADVFLLRNERKQIPPYDKFHIACTANRVRETAIRRAVEANGQKISRDRNEGISTVGALGKVYDQSGDVVLGQVIRVINLGFGGDPLAFDQSVIEGLGLVFNRFNGRTNEKALGHRLSQLKHGAKELLRKAEALKERTGNQKKHCVAATVIDVYNRGEAPHSKGRLPSWWKERPSE